MKKNIGKGIISAVLAIIMLICSGAMAFSAYAAGETSGACGETAQYKIDNEGTLTIWGYGSIANSAFNNVGRQIKTVAIKEGITSIGEKAFFNKKDIVSVSLPESLNTIENWAFYGCKGLEKINLNNVEEIGGCAFEFCTKLKNFGSFCTDKTVSIHTGAFSNSGIESLYIPENVKLIEGSTGSSGVFASCESLKKVTVNTNYISSEAFKSCKNLSSVNFGNKVETIGNSAFAYAGIVNLVVPENVSFIGASAFVRCEKMISADLSNSSVTIIPDDCFCYCTKLKSIELPKKTEEIMAWSFFACQDLVSIKIPASVKDIAVNMNARVFEGCSNLAIIEVENGNEFFYSTTADGMKSNAIIKKAEDESGNDYIIYGCKNTIVPHNVDVKDYAFRKSNIDKIYIYDGIKYFGSDECHIDGIGLNYNNITDIFFMGTEEDWIALDKYRFNNDQITIHYNWNGEVRRTVYLNPNSADATVSTLKYENVLSTQKVVLPTPKWDGHKCLGWSVYSNAKTAEYKCGELYTTEINVTLYAVWENNESGSDQPQPPVSESIVKESNDKNISCTYENGDFGTVNDNDLSLVVKEIEVGTSEFASFQTVITDGDPIAAYSIKIVDKDNKVCQPQSGQSVTIKIKIPEGIKATDSIFIYHKTNDGKTERIKMSDGKVKFENGYIVFETSSFSHFVVVKETLITPENPGIKSVSVDDISLAYKSSAKLNTIIKADKDAEYSVRFTSSNPKVATVDEVGKVTATGKGTAEITCTVTDPEGNVATDTCTVKVTYTWWQWIIKVVLFGWIWY